MGSLLQALFGFLGGLMSDITGFANVNSTNDANKEIADYTNATNYLIAQKTNQTNERIAQGVNITNALIAEDTNKTNKQIADDANALARQESEKAYQRSTQTNQIAELMRAGFSAQQAKQIVAGSGSAASYPAAPVQAATMQAATMQPWQAQAATMQPYQMQPFIPSHDFGFSALGSIGDDLFREDGGSFGSLIAQPALNSLSQHMDKLGSDFWASPDSAQKMYRSEEWRKNNPWFTDKMAKQLDRTFSNVLGTRAFMQQGNKINSSYSVANIIESQRIGILRDRINLNIESATESSKIMIQKTAEELQQIELQMKGYDLQLKPKEFAARSASLMVAFSKENLNLQLLNDENYRKLWCARNLSDEQTLMALNDAKIVHAQYEKLVGDEKVQFAEDYAPYIATWEIFDDAGLTKTDAGAIIALLMGSTQALSNKDGIISNIKRLFGTGISYKEQLHGAKSDVVNAAINNKNSLDKKIESLVQ